LVFKNHKPWRATTSLEERNSVWGGNPAQQAPAIKPVSSPSQSAHQVASHRDRYRYLGCTQAVVLSNHLISHIHQVIQPGMMPQGHSFDFFSNF